MQSLRRKKSPIPKPRNNRFFKKQKPSVPLEQMAFYSVEKQPGGEQSRFAVFAVAFPIERKRIGDQERSLVSLRMETIISPIILMPLSPGWVIQRSLATFFVPSLDS